MDNILRNLESLSRTELVWLNTYLVGRLRALPPENDSQPPVPEVVPHGSVAMQGPNGVTSQQGAKIAPLPDRIDAFNSSLGPWERTGAAPQGWATHLRHSLKVALPSWKTWKIETWSWRMTSWLNSAATSMSWKSQRWLRSNSKLWQTWRKPVKKGPRLCKKIWHPTSCGPGMLALREKLAIAWRLHSKEPEA